MRWFGKKPITLEELLGKTILVGLTTHHSNGETSLSQFVGRVSYIEADSGVWMDLLGSKSGEQWVMPPDVRGLQRAKKGSYTLESTGETVEDPDFLATWIQDEPHSVN